MERNQQTITPEKINRKFLNYQSYSAFRGDLDNEKILDDAIVFIKDVRRIWTHGAEYNCNTQVQVNDGTITILDADGNTILSEKFPKQSEFESAIQTINNNINIVSRGLVTEHDRAIAREQELNNDIIAVNNRVTNVIGGSQGESLNRLRRDLNQEVTTRGREDERLSEQIRYEANRASNAEQGIRNTITSIVQSDPDGVINKFNEIVSFLNNISDTSTLNGILSGIGSQISAKQNNLTAGEGIDITGDTISVEDYIGERDINGKLNTLQQMLGQIYVLKQDIYNPEQTWSEAPIYSFGDLPSSGGQQTPNKSDIFVLNQNAFNTLEENNELRNDVCYLITD